MNGGAAIKVLAIDPGRDKCGVAIVTGHNEVLWRGVIARDDLLERCETVVAEFAPHCIVLGHSTASRDVQNALQTRWPQLPLHIVNERNSTLQARDLFWQEYPPRGRRRLVPLSLQVPPTAIDDFAAVVLAQRFFAAHHDMPNDTASPVSAD